MLTASWSDDMFPFDVEAWDDTDGDGLTDYIDPNSTVNDYQTVQLCGTSTGTGTAGSGSQPSATGNYLTLATGSSATCTFTLPAGETLDVVLNTYSYGSEASLTMVMPDGTSVDMGSFSSFTTSTWSYTDAGTYSFTLGDSWGDGGQMLTTSWSDDMFPFDVEAWDDTDGDGLTDYIDPNSTVNDYQTVQLCGTSTGTGTGGSGSQPSATGNYLTLATGSSATCTFTLPAGETLDLVVQTKGYGSEGGVTITDPSLSLIHI